jgi:hypothetical protein
VENNINEEQPVPLPDQEEPAQDLPSVEIKSKPNIKKILVILLAFLLLISIGISAYPIIRPISAKPVDNDNTATENNTEIIEEEPFLEESPFAQFVGEKTSNNSGCDNYDCLISAAQNCEPTTAIISYTNKPNPMFERIYMPDTILTSGQTVYEIKKSDEGNLCSIHTTYLSFTVSFTDTYRDEMLSQGLTEQEINSELEMINDSINLEGLAQTKEVCTASGSVIAEFLRDSRNGNIIVETDMFKIVYTTLSGNRLECITQ